VSKQGDFLSDAGQEALTLSGTGLTLALTLSGTDTRLTRNVCRAPLFGCSQAVQRDLFVRLNAVGTDARKWENQFMPSYASQHLAETAEIVQKVDPETLERMVDLLADVRARGGRLFFLGVGGSAANASHAVNDFRKIAGIESYAPTDNVSELTARTNDEGWASVFVEWLKGSRLQSNDALMVFSVGGGNLEKNVSPNLVSALQYGKQIGASILGVVGRDGGYTAKVADACCIVPTVNPQNVTPHSEAFQAVIWHLLVSHPKLKVQQTKWEAVAGS
jgi:D-sedoheptulose 7-phosphate isomerase